MLTCRGYRGDVKFDFETASWPQFPDGEERIRSWRTWGIEVRLGWIAEGEQKKRVQAHKSLRSVGSCGEKRVKGKKLKEERKLQKTYHPNPQSPKAWQQIVVEVSREASEEDPSPENHWRWEVAGLNLFRTIGLSSCGLGQSQIQSRRLVLQGQGTLWTRWRRKMPEEEVVVAKEVGPE